MLSEGDYVLLSIGDEPTEVKVIKVEGEKIDLLTPPLLGCCSNRYEGL